jgi:hypothetical protein
MQRLPSKRPALGEGEAEMSIRAWYDYYVIDPGPGTLSLAMRFYKWGDGTPKNALGEYLIFSWRVSDL